MRLCDTLVDSVVRDTGSLQVLPQIEDGKDYHGVRDVLLVSGTMQLWWVHGGEYWQDGEQLYSEPTLQIAIGDRTGLHSTVLHTGGRLTRSLLRRYAKEIDRTFCYDAITSMIIAGTTYKIGL